MKQIAVVLALAISSQVKEVDRGSNYYFFTYFCVLQVRGDWSGQGTLVCYSHFETTADFPEGAANAGRADVTCRPVVWEYATGLGPEAMTFQPVTGDPFDIFAVSQF